MTGAPPRAADRLRATARLYLTFDDGPDARWTPRILDILAAAEMHATFFMIGCRVAAHAALARRIAAHGHELGNHTWSHRHPWRMREAAARQEVRDGAAAVADVIGRPPMLFRPPHGRLRRCMIDEAGQGGQLLVLWTRSALDWGSLGTAHLIGRRLRAARAGDIILMHDARGSINRPDALVRVLPGFLAAWPRLHDGADSVTAPHRSKFP